MSKDKLYVCLDDNNSLSLHSREDVDSTIKNVEEDYDGSMPFTVVGNIAIPYVNTFYLITYKSKAIVFYEVVGANSKEDAEKVLLGKKRLKGKQIVIQNIKDLTDLVNKYYE